MKDTGGPAFPFWCDSNGMANFQGMTLRDYFAAMAMQALLTRIEMSGAERARDAYIIANAMLAERNKT
jgi:hypothetical protein